MKDFIIIGVDGGATKIHAREVVYDEEQDSFSLGEYFSNKSFRDEAGYDPDFVPVDLEVQIGEAEPICTPTHKEQRQGTAYIHACGKVVKDVAIQARYSKVLVGVGMPGLKTKDGRGIATMFNGPRMLSFAEDVEALLVKEGLELIAPIAHLGSDADYCGVGEELAQLGSFKGVSNAYYLGGGTGSADAMKLDGNLLFFNEIKEWIAKTWELKNKRGLSLEQVTSVGGIQKLYAEESGTTVDALNVEGVYPLQIVGLALKGNKHAIKTYQVVTESISDLLYERIVTLCCGWKKQFEFVNSFRPALCESHEYMGSYFDKIIIGQRLGQLFDDEDGKKMVRNPVLEQLTIKLQNSPYLDLEAKKHYDKLEDVVITSRLREAPTLGAGIDAWLSYCKPVVKRN